MISANALDLVSNESAEHLTATEEGRRIARNLAEALNDYADRAGRAGQNPRETANTILATLGNALEAAIYTPREERAALEQAERAERQAREKLEQAKHELGKARANREAAADAYDAATDRNHSAKE